MSQRPGFTVTVRLPAESPPSPNQQRPEATCEIRLHWPSGQKAFASDALEDAFHDAVVRLREVD